MGEGVEEWKGWWVQSGVHGSQQELPGALGDSPRVYHMQGSEGVADRGHGEGLRRPPRHDQRADGPPRTLSARARWWLCGRFEQANQHSTYQQGRCRQLCNLRWTW